MARGCCKGIAAQLETEIPTHPAHVGETLCHGERFGLRGQGLEEGQGWGLR